MGVERKCRKKQKSPILLGKLSYFVDLIKKRAPNLFLLKLSALKLYFPPGSQFNILFWNCIVRFPHFSTKTPTERCRSLPQDPPHIRTGLPYQYAPSLQENHPAALYLDSKVSQRAVPIIIIFLFSIVQLCLPY